MGGEEHNVAVKSDGTVWCWGWNAYAASLATEPPTTPGSPVQTGLAADPPLTNCDQARRPALFHARGQVRRNDLGVGHESVWADGQRHGQSISGPQVTVPVMVSNSGPGGAINNPCK